MRIPLLPTRPAPSAGPRCVVCQMPINGDPRVTVRGMHFHRGCATYKVRTGRGGR